jgi:PAS domain S-box-containing protein
VSDDQQRSPERVLVLAPTAKDAEVTRALLERAGLQAVACDSPRTLSREVEVGAGAALVTEEAIAADGIETLLDVLARQPAWSELPVVMLMRGGVQSPTATRVIRSLRNVTLLERPAPMRSVLSAVEAAVRSRRRQYQIRDQIEQIRQGEERYRRLVELSPDAIFVNAGGAIAFVNPAMVRLFGARSAADLLGRSPLELIDPQSRPHASARARIAPATGETVPATEETWRRLDGMPIEVEAASVAILWENRPAVQVILRDVADRKRAQREREELLESERAARAQAERANRIKDEFLSTVSHELRTPLNAILGWSQLLRNLHTDPQEVLSGIEIVERNARLQAQLIEDLLDMGRIISGKIRLDLQHVDPAAVVDAALESVRPAADAKGVRIIKVLDSPGYVHGDPTRLQQVLWNLLSNAVKFTPEGGRVTLTLRSVESHVRIDVADTGEGIGPEFLPHVFERFRQADAATTRRHGGLGLGLAIVKQLVELHGGTVGADSPGEGLGATFSVNLPLIAVRHQPRDNGDARAAAAAVRAECEMTDLSGVKILVVDDDDDARGLVKRLLTGCHAEVTTAASAREALEQLKKERPHVLLSDIGMPGMDGYDLIREIRAVHFDRDALPAAALTAFARSEDRRRALLAGYQTHLAKPVEPAELIAVVASLAGRTGAPLQASKR